MIIDVHAHGLMADGVRPSMFEWEIPELAGREESPAAVAEYVRRSPVDRMIFAAQVVDSQRPDLPAALALANDRTRAFMAAAPDVFFGACAVNPHALEASLAEMARGVRELGFCCIGEVVPHVQGFRIDSEPVRAIVEKAVALDTALLLHSSEREHIADIVTLARDYPRARIVMAHLGGFRFWHSGVEAVRPLANVSVDLSAWCLFCMGALDAAVRRLGARRVLFGTDFPLIDLPAAVAMVRDADLSEDDQERIFWKNAVEIFQLDL